MFTKPSKHSVCKGSYGIHRIYNFKRLCFALDIPCEVCFEVNIKCNSKSNGIIKKKKGFILLLRLESIDSQNYFFHRIFSCLFILAQLMRYTEAAGHDNLSPKCVWHYCFTLNESYFWHVIYTIFLHFVPAAIVDFFAICLRKKPQ